MILNDYNGQVPDNLEDLNKLDGVGRKTANVIYSVHFGGDAIAVDTHVFRISKRLALSAGNNPLKVEKDLMNLIDKDKWSKLHHLLIYHGRTPAAKGQGATVNFVQAQEGLLLFLKKGEITEGVEVILELKTIADVGLCGFPNVGKSTLLSVISAARPKIADYHFTTLHPNLGIVRYDEQSFLAADIPGLIEGSAKGKGLGHEFLRHIERVRVLIHVVDMSASEGRDPYDDFATINNELKTYSKKLEEIPQIIAANKMDLNKSKENLAAFKKRVKNFEIVPISAITKDGVTDLIKKTLEILQKTPKAMPVEYTAFFYTQKDKTEFEIVKEKDGIFIIIGGLVDMLAKNVTIDDYDSFNYFQKNSRT
ncbi:developmentally regulated gtp-binding protein-related [Holotrichia oblita]|nr:developmentally regulated gtp-binding protein-related [Holotrichia oblita]